MTTISAAILLLFVMDPFGGIPLFLCALENIPKDNRRKIIIRECLIAFVVLLIFLFIGNELLRVLHLSRSSLGIAGGIILFLIALRIIFMPRQAVMCELPKEEPFIVPLAIPLIAGPSAIATVMLLASRWPNRTLDWVLALTAAQIATTAVLSAGGRIADWLKPRGLSALERLMGLLLTAIAIQMLLDGIKEFLAEL